MVQVAARFPLFPESTSSPSNFGNARLARAGTKKEKKSPSILHPERLNIAVEPKGIP